ncbi:hypothetical protein FOXYSP1_06792 [Fusarium oxysporum f. sp. phaseoli]
MASSIEAVNNDAREPESEITVKCKPNCNYHTASPVFQKLTDPMRIRGKDGMAMTESRSTQRGGANPAQRRYDASVQGYVPPADSSKPFPSELLNPCHRLLDAHRLLRALADREPDFGRARSRPKAERKVSMRRFW